MRRKPLRDGSGVQRFAVLIVKNVDKSSPVLMLVSAAGEHDPTVTDH